MNGRQKARSFDSKVSRQRLAEIMKTKVATVEAREAASAAWSQMRRRGIRHLLVTDKGQLQGVLTERDLATESSAGFRKGRMVEDLMTPRTLTAESTTTLRRAADLMGRRRIGCLPIVDDGRLVGVVTATDVLDELSRNSLRAHFRAVVPRPLKTTPAGTAAKVIPAHIRVFGANLSEEQRKRVRQTLAAKLGKFAHSIERVSVRVKDVNGPRGGIDQLCSVKVVLRDHPSVVFENQSSARNAAIDGALAGVERAVRRKLRRRRAKSLKQA